MRLLNASGRRRLAPEASASGPALIGRVEVHLAALR